MINGNLMFEMYFECLIHYTWRIVTIAGADPGFPVEGGTDPLGGGRQHTIFVKFSQKLHEIEKILGRRRGARTGGAPLDHPLHWLPLATNQLELNLRPEVHKKTANLLPAP